MAGLEEKIMHMQITHAAWCVWFRLCRKGHNIALVANVWTIACSSGQAGLFGDLIVNWPACLGRVMSGQAIWRTGLSVHSYQWAHAFVNAAAWERYYLKLTNIALLCILLSITHWNKWIGNNKCDNREWRFPDITPVQFRPQLCLCSFAKGENTQESSLKLKLSRSARPALCWNGQFKIIWLEVGRFRCHF